MRSWKAWLWIAAVFVAGAIFGAVTSHCITVSMARKALQKPEYGRHLMVKRLTWKLNLREDQAKSIDGIIADAQVGIRDLRRDAQPRLGEILKNAERQIEEVLDAEQQEKFRKLLEERRKFWRPEAD